MPNAVFQQFDSPLQGAELWNPYDCDGQVATQMTGGATLQSYRENCCWQKSAPAATRVHILTERTAHAPERRAARARGAVGDPVPGRSLRWPLRPDHAAAARASGDESGGETAVSAGHGADRDPFGHDRASLITNRYRRTGKAVALKPILDRRGPPRIRAAPQGIRPRLA